MNKIIFVTALTLLSACGSANLSATQHLASEDTTVGAIRNKFYSAAKITTASQLQELLDKPLTCQSFDASADRTQPNNYTTDEIKLNKSVDGLFTFSIMRGTISSKFGLTMTGENRAGTSFTAIWRLQADQTLIVEYSDTKRDDDRSYSHSDLLQKDSVVAYKVCGPATTPPTPIPTPVDDGLTKTFSTEQIYLRDGMCSQGRKLHIALDKAMFLCKKEFKRCQMASDEFYSPQSDCKESANVIGDSF